MKSKRILQDKDENVFEYEYGIEEDDGQNCRDIFQVEVEVANVMWQRTVNVPHQINCITKIDNSLGNRFYNILKFGLDRIKCPKIYYQEQLSFLKFWNFFDQKFCI